MNEPKGWFVVADELPVLHLTPEWSDFVHVDPKDEPLCNVRPKDDDQGQPVWEVLIRAHDEQRGVFFFSFPVQPVIEDEFEQNPDGSMRLFGIRKIGPRTWKVIPSVNMPQIVHAFVVLCNVPEPPPWETAVAVWLKKPPLEAA